MSGEEGKDVGFTHTCILSPWIFDMKYMNTIHENMKGD